MVGDLYARERSAQMLSSLITVMAIAPMLGPIVGGQILVIWSWQAIFWTLGIFGLMALAALFVLPETLPLSRRSPLPLSRALAGYVVLLRDPRVVGYALSGGFFYGGIFAYIAGTPFAYFEYYRVQPQAYGLLFAIVIIGIMGTNLLNRQLVIRLGSDRLLRVGTWIAAIAGLAVVLEARFGWGGLAGLVVALTLYCSMSGFIVANSASGAIAASPERAGAVTSTAGHRLGSGL